MSDTTIVVFAHYALMLLATLPIIAAVAILERRDG